MLDFTLSDNEQSSIGVHYVSFLFKAGLEGDVNMLYSSGHPIMEPLC